MTFVNVYYLKMEHNSNLNHWWNHRFFTHTHVYTITQQLHCEVICCTCIVGVIINMIRHYGAKIVTLTMHKTHTMSFLRVSPWYIYAALFLLKHTNTCFTKSLWVYFHFLFTNYIQRAMSYLLHITLFHSGSTPTMTITPIMSNSIWIYPPPRLPPC